MHTTQNGYTVATNPAEAEHLARQNEIHLTIEGACERIEGLRRLDFARPGLKVYRVQIQVHVDEVG